MATQMTDRLDNLYVAAIDRDASLMHANAVSACARWCGEKTTPAQLQDFVNRQIASLQGLNDSLSCEIRDSWQWLAGGIDTAPDTAPVTEPARMFSLRSRKTAATSFGATRTTRDSVAA